MARFFLALGVGRQDVAGPPPDVVQAPHLAADGIVGQAPAAASLQVLLEERDGPVRSGIAQLIGALLQRGQQQRLQFRRPEAGASTAVAVLKGRCTAPGLEGPRPVVDGLPRHPEPLGDLGDGIALVQRQDGQQAPTVAGIVGVPEPGGDAAPLRRRQPNIDHGSPP
jgi:hypothetical protein